MLEGKNKKSTSRHSTTSPPRLLLSPPRPSSGRFPRGMTPATRSTECAAAHRPCGRLPSLLPPVPPAARTSETSLCQLRRAALGGMGWREADVTSPPPFLTRQPPPPPPPPLPVHVTHLFPFAPTPLVLFPRPGRLLVARYRVSLAPSPLFILPPRGRRRAQDTGGSPVSPVAAPLSPRLFLAIEPAESDALSSRVPRRRVQRFAELFRILWFRCCSAMRLGD